MQRPSTGELLRGLGKSLSETVLPVVPRGVAHQQMKAALHLIRRLERSWDLAAAHLAQDNADIEAVVRAILPESGPDSLEARLAASTEQTPAGYNDPALRAAAVRNLALHELLLELPESPEKIALYARMAARDAVYVGDRRPGEGAEP